MSKVITKDINKALNSDLTKDFLDYVIPSISPVPKSSNKGKYIFGGIITIISLVIVILLILYLTGVIGKRIEPTADDEKRR